MEHNGIYQNGITAQQYKCHLSLSNEQLHIYMDNAGRELIIWDLTKLHSCHLNGSSLIIKYGAYPHQTLECQGAIADHIYRVWSQRNIVRHAEGYTFKKRYTALIIFIIVFVALGSFALLYAIPWMGEKAAGLIPIEAEIQMGEKLSSVYAQDGVMDDSLNYYMNEFVKQLELDETYTIDVKVLKSKEINAFALPGGKIFVYSGIIEQMNSYEELVALLGHEVTHVVNRHSLKSICRSAATGMVVAVVFGDVTGISSGIVSQAEEFKQLDYSRDLETEADLNGLNIMVQNKVDPAGMLKLLELLKEEGAKMPYLMKYLSTHPDTDSRIAVVNADPKVKSDFRENVKLEAIFAKLKARLEE